MKLLVVLALVLLALVALANVLKRSAVGPVQRYRRNQPFLTNAERSFFGVLQQAVGSDDIVFAKVRVADVLTPAKGTARRAWQTAFNQISAKHFDFVVCDASEVSPRLAIELDDASHAQAKRIKRDDFLDAACNSAGFPLLRIPARRAYSILEIREQLALILTTLPDAHAALPDIVADRTVPTIALPATPAGGPTQPSEVPNCPRCAVPMVLRTGRAGALSGKEFWGCSTFPRCRYVQPV